METSTTPVLFVTANVGSIFEDPEVMLKIWTREFLSTVTRLDPKFIALHCQEMGGKNYEESMQHVDYFVKLLMESEELRLFDKVRIFLDEEYSSAETFTALGNLYFIHESITDVLIWDFKELCFVGVEGKDVFAGFIEDVPTKEKTKFPQDFFPECKWSRKGFLRTRWNLKGTVFDLVNLHLFHDASNFTAMESFPSVYSQTRQRALEYTLDRFHNDEFATAPLFLFGDFNFRTDTHGVIKRLSDGLTAVKPSEEKNSTLQYTDSEGQIVFTLGTKKFSHQNHQTVFHDDLWLKEYDKELEGFCGQLFEFPISFPPSYPFVEDNQASSDYMHTRCPAWCDRVILSQTAKPLIASEEGCVEYGLIGKDACMGDHKPVYLKGALLEGAGRVSCCDSQPRPPLSITHEEPPPLPTTSPPSSPDSALDAPVIFDLASLGEDEVEAPNRPRPLDSPPPPHKPPARPLTERYIVKRVHSASIVEVKVGVMRGSCKGNEQWRSRSVSVSGKPTWRSGSRVRLISHQDLRASMHRLQSHHSSSEEEWFEEVERRSQIPEESERSSIKTLQELGGPPSTPDPPPPLSTQEGPKPKHGHLPFRLKRKVKKRPKRDTVSPNNKCCTLS